MVEIINGVKNKKNVNVGNGLIQMLLQQDQLLL